MLLSNPLKKLQETHAKKIITYYFLLTLKSIADETVEKN